MLFVLIEGADRGFGYLLGIDVGADCLAGAGFREVQQRDPAVGRMRAPGYQATGFQAVDHVGDRAGPDVQDLADLAHAAVTVG